MVWVAKILWRGVDPAFLSTSFALLNSPLSPNFYIIVAPPRVNSTGYICTGIAATVDNRRSRVICEGLLRRSALLVAKLARQLARQLASGNGQTAEVFVVVTYGDCLKGPLPWKLKDTR